MKLLLNFESLGTALDADGPETLRLLRDGRIPKPIWLGDEPRWSAATLQDWADCGFPSLEPCDGPTMLAIRKSLI